MFIRIGYEFCFDLTRPTHMVLMLSVHPEHAPRLLHPERVFLEPQMRIDEFTDCFGNRAARIMAPPGKLRISYDNVVTDSGEPEARIDGQRLHQIDECGDGTTKVIAMKRLDHDSSPQEVCW